MSLLSITFIAPLAGFVLLAFSRGRLGENTSALIGITTVGISLLAAVLLAHGFDGPRVETLWTWMALEDFNAHIGLRLDELSLTMLTTVAGVSFLIHVFAAWYMRSEEGYSRFFAYMNLFVASMLVLVLADNLLLLYLGWEGVGLCSYLLIGFYYSGVVNNDAAMKAFLVTRTGDVFMAIGLFILINTFHTLNIEELLTQAPQRFASNDPLMILVALLLLGGAVGKSAQLPLQTWLPDAMAGPTPVSALIHAATMVTAGVYLIARTHGVYELAPDALTVVGWVGALTLLLAGLCALAQTDIKRVLAYSTMSQIGYMFLALGAGAWGAAIFHLMTHAFFKALLFLTSGSVIIACHHEQDIRKMGGLRHSLPFEYACFLVGGLSLCALPFVTAGFYSKDEILWSAYAGNNMALFAIGLFGALLTSIYTFRLIFTVFHGKEQISAHPRRGLTRVLPLGALLALSTTLGALFEPQLASVLPASPGEHGGSAKHLVETLSGGAAIIGIGLAAWLFLGQRQLVNRFNATTPGRFLGRWWLNAFGFDALYDRLFVRPFNFLAREDRRDGLDLAVGLLVPAARGANRFTVTPQTGRLRWYVASIALGALVMLVVAMINLH